MSFFENSGKAARRREIEADAWRARRAAEAAETAAALQRTEEILSESADKRREAQLKELYLEKLDLGAPDAGVKFEMVLETHVYSKLGDKVLLPPSVLEALSSNALFPYMFELELDGVRTHCGVAEFTAEEGTMGVPPKVARCLKLGEGTKSVRVRYKHLERCEGITLKVTPHDVDYEIFRKVLETELRDYVTLSCGDVLHVGGNEIEVVRIRPNELAVCLIDADIDLEFIDYEQADVWKVGESRLVTRSEQKLYTQNPNGVLLLEGSGLVCVSSPGLFEYVSSRLRVQLENANYVYVTVEEGEDFVVFTQWEQVMEGFGPCPNCMRQVAQASLQVHLLRCEPRKQCTECGQEYIGNHQQHVERWHKNMDCACGETIKRYENMMHQSSDCTEYNVLCRFCGLEKPRGDLSLLDPRDRIMGFESIHEAQCGNRTDKCNICNRSERLKDMQFHMQAYHNFPTN